MDCTIPNRFCKAATDALRLFVLAASIIPGVGCSAVRAPSTEHPLPVLPEADELRGKIDVALEFNQFQRVLNTKDHAAWQVVHGILAYGSEFEILHEGKKVPALEFLLQGGKLKGWEFEPGDVLDASTGRRGLRAIIQEGTNIGQGHVDQWLGYLSLCKLDISTKLTVDGDTFTLRDYLEQAQRDVFRNPSREYSWTIMALSQYYPSNLAWVAGDGKHWTLEQLVAAEANQDILHSACGGTHRLFGLSVALNRHLEKGGALVGGWADADKQIRQCVELARKNQNPSGAFSTRYLDGPGSSPDADLTLDTSGHVFEFLACTLSDQELREPWMVRGAANLCEMVRRTRKLNVKSGGLYHAMHGLVLYRERRFGPRD